MKYPVYATKHNINKDIIEPAKYRPFHLFEPDNVYAKEQNN